MLIVVVNMMRMGGVLSEKECGNDLEWENRWDGMEWKEGL